MQLARSLALMAAAIGVALAAPVLAHPQLVSSSPVNAASAQGVKTVTLTFGEAFMPQMSGLEIVMTGMPGMAAGEHPPMKMTGVKVSASPDRKSLIATLVRPLPMGTYDVSWHVMGADSHHATGKISFSAR